LKPGGQYYNPQENFLNWAPGAENPPTPPRTYSNVAYGLLGHLVERVSGVEFNAYCRAELFDVLGMKNTRWKIGDPSQHAVPYTYIDEKMVLGDDESLKDYLVAESVRESDVSEGAILPHCLYSFYNYPDGLLRTNPIELASFLRAYIGGGQLEGKRILKEGSVKEMLTEQYDGQGLCWAISTSSSGDRTFHHGGGDPGISTIMGFNEKDGVGAIVLFNCSNPGEHKDNILEGMNSLMNKLVEK